jgi:hypothetical protein
MAEGLKPCRAEQLANPTLETFVVATTTTLMLLLPMIRSRIGNIL